MTDAEKQRLKSVATNWSMILWGFKEMDLLAKGVLSLLADQEGRGAGGWQPIETAPKDQRILTPDGIASMGLYGNWNMEGDSDAFAFSGPKFWMPLPPPPVEGPS